MIKNELDEIIISKVKKIREEKGFTDMQALSKQAGYYPSLVANAENPERRDKYNIYHLNGLAKAMKCSIKDFLPDNPV